MLQRITSALANSIPPIDKIVNRKMLLITAIAIGILTGLALIVRSLLSRNAKPFQGQSLPPRIPPSGSVPLEPPSPRTPRSESASASDGESDDDNSDRPRLYRVTSPGVRVYPDQSLFASASEAGTNALQQVPIPLFAFPGNPQQAAETQPIVISWSSQQAQAPRDHSQSSSAGEPSPSSSPQRDEGTLKTVSNLGAGTNALSHEPAQRTMVATQQTVQNLSPPSASQSPSAGQTQRVAKPIAPTPVADDVYIQALDQQAKRFQQLLEEHEKEVQEWSQSSSSVLSNASESAPVIVNGSSPQRQGLPAGRGAFAFLVVPPETGSQSSSASESDDETDSSESDDGMFGNTFSVTTEETPHQNMV